MSSYSRTMQPISDARDHGRRRDSESVQSDYGEQSSLNLKRPSVDNGQNSSRKKSKVVTACTQCVKRKSRCELVTEAGCHRCVVLQTDCSLRGTVPIAGPSRSTAQSVAGDSPETIGSELNSRLERIEDRLDKLLVGRDHNFLQPGPERGEVIDWYTMAPDYNTSGSLSSNALKIMGRPRLSFEDPVAAGIVSPIELKYIHEKFISICDDIFHVTQLGVSPASPPTDLFLQTCILYYIACVKDATFAMPKEQRHSIYALMDRQYVIMLRADPSKDLALGLLILTYSPVPQVEYNVIHADPFRAAGLAYQMAADLGLEESVIKLRTLRTHEITWKLYAKLLDDLGLWFSIFHRYIWGKIVGSPNQDGSRGSVPFYLMVRFDVHYIQSSSLFVHLWLESELLDCATAPVRACGRVRVEEQFHQHLLDDYVTDLERAEARIAETRRSISSTPNLRTSWYLTLETYHLAYALAMQGSVEVRNMPSPLAAQLRFDALIRFGSKLIRHMGDYLWHIILTRPDLSTLPVYFSPPIYLGLATVQGWDLADKLLHPSRPGVALSVEIVFQILEEDLVSSPQIIARIRRIPKYRLDTRQIPRPESMPTSDHGTGMHPGGQLPHQDMVNGLAPQYTQPFDAFGGDMSWLLDFETDWTALVNNGRVGDY